MAPSEAGGDSGKVRVRSRSGKKKKKKERKKRSRSLSVRREKTFGWRNNTEKNKERLGGHTKTRPRRNRRSSMVSGSTTGNLDFNSDLCVCVCVCVCAFLRKEKSGKLQSQGLINYIFFF